MPEKKRIFVSSVQKELAVERRAVKDFVHGDALLRRFFEVFLFEDLPASDRRADEVYLGEVDRCNVYVGLFGREYGFEDREGVSPTEREFRHATASGKERLVFVHGADDAGRYPKMRDLIRQAGDEVIRRRFGSVPELTAALYASLVDYLERSGALNALPFDATGCARATLDDLAADKVEAFLRRAQAQRGYPLGPGTPLDQALTHLNLLDDGQPTHAAVLLFGRQPQRFLPTSEMKCLHFHGTEVRKPIPSYQVYKGTVFELVDQAVDFVLSKIAAAVGTRAESNQAPLTYEIPRDAVSEAIVNAVAHRDYASNASVQVMLFADRLEIWNPGELPPALTPARLFRPHASIPRNPLLAEPLFLARYIERAGTGTLDMVALSAAAGLQPPEFKQDGGQFVQTLWRPKTTATPQVTPQVEREDKPLPEAGLHDLAMALGLPATQVTPQVTTQVVKLLAAALAEAKSREDLQGAAGLLDREHFRRAYIEPLMTAGWLERTIPDKPTSRLQRYRLTARGRAWLDKSGG